MDKEQERQVLTAVNNHKWASRVIRSIAINYTSSVLHNELFKSDPPEYIRRWHELRSKSDGRARFPEDMIHEIIEGIWRRGLGGK